jgi:hypothetical protein
MAKQEKQPQHYHLRMAMADRRALVAMLEPRDDGAPPDDSRAWLERLSVWHDEAELQLKPEMIQYQAPFLTVYIGDFDKKRGDRLTVVLDRASEWEARRDCFVDGGQVPMTVRLDGPPLADLIGRATVTVSEAIHEESEEIGGRLEGLDETGRRIDQRLRGADEALGGLRDSIRELTYAPQGPAGAWGGAAASPAGRHDLTAVVGAQVRSILGYQPRNASVVGELSEGKRALDALERSFTQVEESGVRYYRWTPRRYHATTDLAAELSGAQASLYRRAKLAVDEVERILTGLEPLQDIDEDFAEATLAVLHALLGELVAELGRVGGPWRRRVDELFEQLLLRDGNALMAEAELSATRLSGRLGALGWLYGYLPVERAHINTPEHEQQATDYRIAVDHVIGLFRSWREGADIYQGFGIQLVQLERLLGVVSESVDEVRAALAAALIGPAEQQMLQLTFQDGSELSVDGLLSWTQEFAGGLGERLIRDGGRLALQTEVRLTAMTLESLVAQVTRLEAGQLALPQAFFLPTVRNAFEELDRYLEALVDATA